MKAFFYIFGVIMAIVIVLFVLWYLLYPVYIYRKYRHFKRIFLTTNERYYRYDRVMDQHQREYLVLECKKHDSYYKLKVIILKP